MSGYLKIVIMLMFLMGAVGCATHERLAPCDVQGCRPRHKIGNW